MTAAGTMVTGDGTWLAPGAKMPTTRYGLGLAAVQGRLHAIGGIASARRNSLSTHEVFDPKANKWSSANAMPTGRYMFGVAVVGNRLYAIGGFSAPQGGTPRAALATNEMFDPATGSWTELAPMPTARGEVAVGVVQGRIHAVGGQSSLGAPTTVHEVYDPITNSWSTCAPLSTPLAGIAGAVVNNGFYLCGGAGANEQTLNAAQAYDAASDTYKPIAPMPTARWLAGAAVAQGQVFVLGGSTFATEDSLAVNEVYDPVADRWSAQDPIPGIGGPDFVPPAAGISGLLTGSVFTIVLGTSESPHALQYMTSAI